MNTVTVHIEKGEITNKQVIRKAFKIEDGAYTVTIQKRKKDRSLQQNKYYWAICLPLVRDGLRYNGYNEIRTAEQAHEVVKSLFLKRNIGEEGASKIIEVVGSTADLSTAEFNQYLEEIWQWGAEFLNITIPSPNEQVSIFLAEHDGEVNATIIEQG